MSGKAQKLLKSAQSYCEAHDFRFTDPRAFTLEIVAESSQPLSAYDILDALGKKLDKPKPPTVYRALEFLQKHGFVHRIESLNAYITCQVDHQHRGSQFMICDGCGKVEEAHLCSLPDSLEKKTKNSGFKISYWNAEIHGVCSACKN